MSKWLASAMILCLLATGCGTVARNETSPSPQNTKGVRVQQTTPHKEPISSPKQVAAHLEALANQVPGVKGAHCVVFNNTAVVGIDVDGKLDRSRVGTIKYAVAEALRKDPYGIDAAVTADMDLTHRLNEMGTDIRQGRPLQGFAEEMSDIIGRIVPQMPRDTQPRNMEHGDPNQPKLQKNL
ncbi:YhcN/YlaJ family sporulation lipoprotein [Paenibacillus sepulcri]|uniref:YhcN/YlaJ family sporulation lipoprotein n=1 Tax=Paenibacillus sepulcri TaxID=359917 RepID=A0ABS7BYF0_9BACL|nr:YhcN/YlaJ family sporulation lipoprotein [Paenibacillus sepulcri]